MQWKWILQPSARQLANARIAFAASVFLKIVAAKTAVQTVHAAMALIAIAAVKPL